MRGKSESNNSECSGERDRSVQTGEARGIDVFGFFVSGDDEEGEGKEEEGRSSAVMALSSRWTSEKAIMSRGTTRAVNTGLGQNVSL